MPTGPRRLYEPFAPLSLNLMILKNVTCQCTMCRKFTGCVLPQNVSIPTSYIKPPLPSNKTYKAYASSPGAFRGFCSNCGSSLTFNENDKPEMTEIHLGSLYEEVLCGKIIGGQRDETIE